jgi:NAD-dependent deacetylase
MPILPINGAINMTNGPKIVFFTGAGISRSAGIPTFRDKDGLWMKVDPDVVASTRGFKKDRWAVADFHNQLRRLIDSCEPTEAHRVIAGLEASFDVSVVTQNVDNLHERAGSSKVIKIHGDLFRARLKRYKEPTIPWRSDILKDSHPEDWRGCAGTMRHDVVLFGEAIQKVKEAESAIARADILVVVGTSLVVRPAADMALDARAPVKALVDPDPAPQVANRFHVVVKKGADEGLSEAVEACLARFSQ